MNKKWDEWEIEEADNLKRIKTLQKKGHTFHCGCRQVWGDGECECNKKNQIPGGISRAMYKGRCMVCLVPDGKKHKIWCRNANTAQPGDDGQI